MHGYCGRLLRVDLSRRVLCDEGLDPEALRRYIGGSGLAAHLFLEAVAPRLAVQPAASGGRGSVAAGFPLEPDPLGPDNPLIVLTGPLTGTRLPSAARWTISARSPLTGLWGEANSGGHLGAALKQAGYDGLVITGRSAEPCYLRIEGGTAGLEPAGDLWGKDTYEVDDLLTARHPGGQVAAIGPAGENLVRYACVMHGKHHAAGRSGLGAVMGAKGLKAIVAVGKGGGAGGVAAPADPEGLQALVRAVQERMAGSIVITTYRETGTLASLDIGGLIGDLPIRNWALGEWDGMEKVSLGSYNEHLTGRATCAACPVGCFREVSLEALGRTLKDAPGAEYETVAMLGPNLLINDFAVIQVANDSCNRLGMDTISAGATLAYAFEAAERGLLGGLPGLGGVAGADGSAAVARLARGWGDGALVVELLADIAYRRGIGNELADGSEALALRIGSPVALEFLTTVKGMEAPAHDPRAAHSWAMAYATTPRGACHCESMIFNLELTGYTAPEVGLDYDGMQQVSEGRGALARAAQDFGCVFGQAAILCHLGGTLYQPADVLSALNLVTGLDYTLDELLTVGARIWHLKRGIGALFGAGPADDRVPPRMLEMLDAGGAAGSVPDIDLMLSEWREARGLDGEGRARPEVLAALGLHRLAELLGNAGNASRSA